MRWRVEMLHRDKPDRDELGVLLEPLVERASLGSLAIDIDRVPQADWVRQVEESLPPRLIGRFWIHGSHVSALAPAGSTPIRLDAGLVFLSDSRTNAGVDQIAFVVRSFPDIRLERLTVEQAVVSVCGLRAGHRFG
ncbi:MAG: hypothetical protein HC871_10745 [Rhizobiales bacterium]|nr:hypothetical protein [Hyphomicrobiales bacterium]